MVDAAGTRPVAALDCGTNSTRLLIVDGAGRALARRMEITRLGAGVDATHMLSLESIDRTVSVLATMKREMDRAGVRRARLVATSAVRDADNGEEFLAEASRVTGIRAELLPGAEEGRLAFAGATDGLRPADCDGIVVVVDIGGGSTEIVVGRAGTVQGVSLDLGCVRLTERCLRHDPPLDRELDQAVRVIHGELDRAAAALPLLEGLPPGSRLLGLAGTVSTLAVLDQGLAGYDRDRVHHSVLARDSVDRWCATLAAEPASWRAARPGMATGREDVIVGGVLVLREVMARFDFVSCMVSETDLLDGLAASLTAPAT